MLIRFHRRAFTLIELMVVVAIMAVITAILVPAFLRARSKGSEAAKQATAEVAAVPQEPPSGQLPLTAVVELQMSLEPEPLRVGFDVLNRYRFNHEGRYLFEQSAGPTVIQIPLAVNHRALDQFKVLRRNDQGEWAVPENLVMAANWLAWVEEGDSPVEVEVRYQSEGEEELWLELPPAGLHKKIAANLDGPDSLTVPPQGLRFSQHGVWERNEILSPPPLVVELPVLEDPLSRVVRLFRYTGLAVLLFGGGFWYLGELHRPGALGRFRFGSFALLAVNYSMFFVCFAVLGFHEVVTPFQNLLISAALTAPILAFQVAQILDWKFSLAHAVPLSLATLGLVFNGVYGGDYRDYVYLGYALMSGLLLTLSYRPFMTNWEAKQTARTQAVESLVQSYRSAQQEARKEKAETAALLEGGRLRSSQVEALNSALAHFHERTKYADLPDDPQTSRDLVESHLRRILEASAELRRERQFIRQSMPDLETPEAAKGHPAHSCCLACGEQALSGRYCCHCSRPLPEIVACPQCETENVIPHHLEHAGPYHCHRCGHRHAVTASMESSQRKII
jgi:prepilin-type N-terminal cleavage/methylation domain-containing protein